MSARKLEALRKERAEKIAAANALAEAEDGMNEEQSTEFDALMDGVSKIDADITRLEKLRAAELAEPAVTETAVPVVGATNVTVEPNIEKDPMRGFTGLGEFAACVKAASDRTGPVVDERLAHLINEANGNIGAQAPSSPHKIVGGSNGDGFMVPPQIRDEVWTIAFESDPILSLADPEPTDRDTVTFNRDETTPWGTGGVTAYWAGEASQLTESNLNTDESTVKLSKVYAFVTASDELLSDAPRLERRLTRDSGLAIGWKVGEAIFRGDGVGKPLGFEAGGSLISVAKETSQTADTIVDDNVSKMYSRCLQGPGSRLVWFANPDTLPQFVGMTIGDQPVFTPPNEGIKRAPNGLLLGVPIVFTEHAKTVGDLGDITLANMAGYYAAAKRGGMKYASSMHLLFDYDAWAFRWTNRVAGQPILQAAVSPANGSNTKSHFVQLAERT